MTRSPRFPLFDALRAIAALSVVLYHAGFYMRGLDGSVGRYLTQLPTGFPAVGVVIFFLISGFLLYRPFAQARFDGADPPRLVPYALRRALRIVPAYWLALPIVALVLDRSGVFTATGVPEYFGFGQVYDIRWLGGGISQAWTLDVEITFYAALPLIALALRRRKPRSRRDFLATELGTMLALALASIGWQTGVIALVSQSSFHYYPALLALPASFDYFAAGMALAALSVAGSRPRLLERYPALAWLGATAAYVVLMHSASLFGGDRYAAWLVPHELRALIAVGLLAPAVFGSAEVGIVRRVLGSPVLLWLGKVSYGIYLWHLVVLVELDKTSLRHAGWVAFLAATLAVTIVLAAVSWYGLERRALALGRRLSGAPGAQAPVAAQA